MAIEDIRQVAQDGDRALHLRRLGTGRPVVLLHESPRSSAVLLPLATRLADRFTVFALDTPGYGLSDPLAMQRPEITDFADAIAWSLRALGLGRVPVYGTHTGATIAAELGRRHPDLVSGLVLDGYPVFTVEERDLHHSFYLKEFPPRWDGGHVVELWSRIRDQFDFFPWYLRSESARLPLPKADLARHRAVLRDFLLSGEHYTTAYAASFRFDAREALKGQSAPIRIVARPTDLLFHQMERLRDLPQDCTVSNVSAEPDAWAAAIATFFDAMPGDTEPPEPSTGLAFSSNGRLCAVDGCLLVRCYGTDRMEARAPVLLLHDSPGSAADLTDLAMRLQAGRRVLVPELPNHGRSSDTGPGCEADETVRLIACALEAAGGGVFDVAGFGAGGQLARLLASLMPTRVRRVIDVGAMPAPSAESARLPARMDGADLIERWFAVRDRALTRPDGARRPLGIGIDVEAIHRRFVAGVLADGRDLRTAETIRARLASVLPLDGAIVQVIEEGASEDQNGEPFVSSMIADRISELLDRKR